jgi:predicted amidohydrolase
MPPEARPFLAAAVQMRSGLDPAANAKAALDFVAAAAAKGARFVSTPEMTNVVDRDADRLFATIRPEAETAEIGRFAEAAGRLGLWLHVGSLAVRTGARRAANRGYLFAPDGRVAARYDKIHRFDVDLPGGESWRESRVYDAGSEGIVARTALADFALTVCYDLRFPHLYRACAQAGAEVFLVPAAFTRQTGEAHWHVLQRARAIECGAFVVAAAQGGVHADGRHTFGHSLIVGPWGEILAEAAGEEPQVILAEIDPARVADARARIPNLKLENEFAVRTIEA